MQVHSKALRRSHHSPSNPVSGLGLVCTPIAHNGSDRRTGQLSKGSKRSQLEFGVT